MVDDVAAESMAQSMSDSVVDEIAKFRARLFDDVMRRWLDVGDVMPVRVLSQRYNKRALRLGLDLYAFCLSDERLVGRESRSGSRFVGPRAELSEMSSQAQYALWKALGCV